MIVKATKLQRDITYHGIDDVLKLSVDTSGALKRLNRSPRDAESVTNLVTSLKSELDKIPSHEQDEIAIEVNTDVSRVWLTVLEMYTRRVTRMEKAANNMPELGGLRNANTAEDSANKLAAQMQDQLNLPIQTLDSIIADQEKRERDEAKEFAKGTESAPHRGVGAKAIPDEGLAKNGPAGDPRNRRGPAGAAGKSGKTGKKWDRRRREGNA
jgi:hypothetical protein